MSIQDLITEANTKMSSWQRSVPAGLLVPPYYEGEEFEAWVQKAMNYLDENFKEKPQTMHFYKLYSGENERKDYHRHKYFKEMLRCLEELA